MNEASVILRGLQWAARWRLLLTVAAIGLGIAGHFEFQRWLSGRIERMSADAELQMEWIEARLDLALLVGAERRKAAAVNAELVSWMERIPDRINDSEIYVQLRDLAKTSGCQFTDFRPLATQTRPEFLSRSFEISLEGEFDQLFAFMLSLHRQPQLHEVSRCYVQESTVDRRLKRTRMEISFPFAHAWKADIAKVVGATP
jgi:Tfp pilus assembly protein PilO